MVTKAKMYFNIIEITTFYANISNYLQFVNTYFEIFMEMCMNL